jgi:uncharacterized membrane protein YbhN (UPF0104 family)
MAVPISLVQSLIFGFEFDSPEFWWTTAIVTSIMGAYCVLLLQIAIGIFDLGAAALAMYVLIPAGMNIDIFRLTAVFIAATLLGFASHAPAGLGVFDAAILLGLGGEDQEPVIAALLMFRFLYHFLPFVIALGLFGGVEAWRGLRGKR